MPSEKSMEKVRTRIFRAQKNLSGFLFCMGYELWLTGERDVKIIQTTARRALTEFLHDEGIRFGDSAYDWSGDSARDLMREMETRHYEAAP